MKYLSFIIALTILSLVACSRTPVANPDPNHTHADFAVWIDGEKLDFSRPEFMSGTSDDHDPDHTKHHQYLHLHDGIGHVIHRHKPGLTLLDFFRSIGIEVRMKKGDPAIGEPEALLLCLKFPQLEKETCESPWRYFLVYTNDPAEGGASFLKDDIDFHDGDSLLISIGDERQEDFVLRLHEQWLLMTSDACLYSRTCPWRGEPPTENCIADPEVPCIAP